MNNVRTIYADWYGGTIWSSGSGTQLAYRYDHLSNMVIFKNAPKLDNYYLIVSMKETEDGEIKTLEPIQLGGSFWLIPNLYTQIPQTISFQVCCRTESGDFEQHSAQFSGVILPSKNHDGEALDVDPTPMFDVYKEWVNEKAMAAGAIVIDPTLSVQGAAADAKAVGDAVDGLNGRLGEQEEIVERLNEGGLDIKDEVIETQITDWLNNHPEATTTVQDGSLTYKKLVNGTLGYVTPQMYGAKADGTTDDTDAIQNAINNSNFVLFEKGIYKISRTIRIHSGLILMGEGADSTIRADAEVVAFSSDDTADIFDVVIDGLGFIGNVILNDASEYPKRGSEFEDDTKHGIVVAISLTGSASKRTQRTHSVKRVTVKNCVFKNIYSLPVILNGCEDEINVCDNYFDNCMDIGIIDCENICVCRNAIIRSRDNGISISSGNKNVVCTDNVILYSGFHGVWVSGWIVDGNVYAGPDTTIVSNNIIKYCGNSAIMAKIMPQNIVISNNYIDTCYLSPLDHDTTSKENGNGIFVSGNGADIAQYADGIFINGNTISNCKRNAVYMQYCHNFKITNNVFRNIGSSQDIDGSAVITGGTVEFNSLLYIFNNDANINSNGELINNSIYDTRNVQVICLSAWCIGSSGIYVYGNIYHNGLPLFEVKTSRNATNVNRFSPSEFNYLINPTVFNYTSSTGDHEIPVTLSAGQMLLITSVSLSTAGKLNMWFVNYTSSRVGYEIINSVSNDSASTLTVNDGKLIYTNTYGRVVAVRYLGMPVTMD